MNSHLGRTDNSRSHFNDDPPFRAQRRTPSYPTSERPAFRNGAHSSSDRPPLATSSPQVFADTPSRRFESSVYYHDTPTPEIVSRVYNELTRSSSASTSHDHAQERSAPWVTPAAQRRYLDHASSTSRVSMSARSTSGATPRASQDAGRLRTPAKLSREDISWLLKTSSPRNLKRVSSRTTLTSQSDASLSESIRGVGPRVTSQPFKAGQQHEGSKNLQRSYMSSEANAVTAATASPWLESAEAGHSDHFQRASAARSSSPEKSTAGTRTDVGIVQSLTPDQWHTIGVKVEPRTPDHTFEDVLATSLPSQKENGAVGRRLETSEASSPRGESAQEESTQNDTTAMDGSGRSLMPVSNDSSELREQSVRRKRADSPAEVEEKIFLDLDQNQEATSQHNPEQFQELINTVEKPAASVDRTAAEIMPTGRDVAYGISDHDLEQDPGVLDTFAESSSSNTLRDWYLAQRNCRRVPQEVVNADPEACSLRTWILVMGLRVTSDGADQWHTSLIASRVNDHYVSTQSGSLWRLEGPCDLSKTRQQGFSKETAVAFRDGFPSDWAEVLRRDLQAVEMQRPALNPVVSSPSQPGPTHSQDSQGHRVRSQMIPAVQRPGLQMPSTNDMRSDEQAFFDVQDADGYPDVGVDPSRVYQTFEDLQEFPAVMHGSSASANDLAVNRPVASSRSSRSPMSDSEDEKARPEDTVHGQNTDERASEVRGPAQALEPSTTSSVAYDQASRSSSTGLHGPSSSPPPAAVSVTEPTKLPTPAATPQRASATPSTSRAQRRTPASSTAKSARQSRMSKELLNLGKSPFGVMRVFKDAMKSINTAKSSALEPTVDTPEGPQSATARRLEVGESTPTRHRINSKDHALYVAKDGATPSSRPVPSIAGKSRDVYTSTASRSQPWDGPESASEHEHLHQPSSTDLAALSQPPVPAGLRRQRPRTELYGDEGPSKKRKSNRSPTSARTRPRSDQGKHSIDEQSSDSDESDGEATEASKGGQDSEDDEDDD